MASPFHEVNMLTYFLKKRLKKELAEDATLEFVTEHQIGIAKEGTDEEMIKDLNTHFLGECTEVGMYLAMSRQADREGYPEVAEAFKRYAWTASPSMCRRSHSSDKG